MVVIGPEDSRWVPKSHLPQNLFICVFSYGDHRGNASSPSHGGHPLVQLLPGRDPVSDEDEGQLGMATSQSVSQLQTQGGK